MQLPDSQDQAEALADWVCREILPHERAARGWLKRSRLPVEADDVIQEAYARIAAMENVAHINSGRAYLLATVRNIALQLVRRSKVVRMDSFADLPAIGFCDEQPGPEAVVWSRKEIQTLILALPERCRAIFHLCRIKGYTQKETAEQLGVSENIVEKQISKAMEVLTTRFGRDGDAS